MSHPDPNGPPDLTPIQVGEVWENPVSRERATILELPFRNPEGRTTAELTAAHGGQSPEQVILSALRENAEHAPGQAQEVAR